MAARFGPAGNSEEFYEAGYKRTLDAPAFLQQKGLNAYEYQCGRGVNVKEETATNLGKKAQEFGVGLSIHAPYYISLASPDEAKRDNSVNYILQSARAAKWMGATRIVVHPGGLGKFTREQATELACETLRKVVHVLDEEGLGDIIVCPETMGKINQLGNLEEVLTFCRLDERMLPCVDFGHLNARTLGSLQTKEDFLAVFDQIENALGADRMRRIHVHFSKIEYSKGGEVRHLTFEDMQYGPDYQLLLDATLQKGAAPTFICESAGTQTQDALAMRQYYAKQGGDPEFAASQEMTNR